MTPAHHRAATPPSASARAQAAAAPRALVAGVGIQQPGPGQHRQRGWRARADDQCQIDHGHRIGQHGQYRPAQARADLGPGHAPPGRRRAVPHAARELQLPAQALGHVRPLQVGGRSPQQERQFLGGQHGDQAQAPGILGGAPGRRRSQPGGPRGQGPQHPAAGRNQECKSDRERGMGYGQHGCEHAHQPGPDGGIETMPQHPGGQADRDQCRGRAGPQAQCQCMPQLCLGCQCAPGICLQGADQCGAQCVQQGHADQRDQNQRQDPLTGAPGNGCHARPVIPACAQPWTQRLSGASTDRRKCPMSSISAGCTLCGIG